MGGSGVIVELDTAESCMFVIQNREVSTRYTSQTMKYHNSLDVQSAKKTAFRIVELLFFDKIVRIIKDVG